MIVPYRARIFIDLHLKIYLFKLIEFNRMSNNGRIYLTIEIQVLIDLQLLTFLLV
jgi:hypothetical protein